MATVQREFARRISRERAGVRPGAILWAAVVPAALIGLGAPPAGLVE